MCNHHENTLQSTQLNDAFTFLEIKYNDNLLTWLVVQNNLIMVTLGFSGFEDILQSRELNVAYTSVNVWIQGQYIYSCIQGLMGFYIILDEEMHWD